MHRHVDDADSRPCRLAADAVDGRCSANGVLGAAEPPADGPGHRRLVPAAACCCCSRSSGSRAMAARWPHHAEGDEAEHGGGEGAERSAGSTRSICGAGLHVDRRAGHAQAAPSATVLERSRAWRPACPAVCRFRHRRHAAGRSADGDHARPWSRSSPRWWRSTSIGYMHGDPGYWRFFTYVGAVRLLDDDAGLGEQLRAALRVLGSGRACAATC